MTKGIKIRRKSSPGTTISTPSPPPPTCLPVGPPLPPVSSMTTSESAVFGQQLLLALSKARAAAFDPQWSGYFSLPFIFVHKLKSFHLVMKPKDLNESDGMPALFKMSLRVVILVIVP